MAEPPTRGKPPAEPGYGEQYEGFMQPGETPEVQEVVNTVLAAKQAMEGMGRPFDIQEALDMTSFDERIPIEQAWIRRRLREKKIEIPNLVLTVFGIDVSALDSLIEEALKEAKRAREVAAPPPAPAAPEMSVEERVDGIATRLILPDFTRKQRDGEAFSIEAAVARHRAPDGLLDEAGINMLKAKLAELGVEDIKEEGAAEAAGAPAGALPAGAAEGGPAAGPIVGRPPEAAAERALRKRKEFRRFEYQSGRLIEVFNYEGGDEEQREQARGMALPAWFAEIAGDPAKVQRCLDALAELYRNLHPRNLKVVPLRERRRRGAPIIGFRLQFIESREDRPLPEEAAILQMVNAAEQESKKYYEAEGFDTWKDAQRRRIVEEYRREKIEALRQELLGAAPAPAGGVAGAVRPAVAEARPVAPPAPALAPGPEAAPEVLRPEEVGLTPEKAERLRAMIRERLIGQYIDILRVKYPKMKEDLLKGNAEYFADEELEQAFQETLAKMRGRA